ncbi:MAG: signal transduction histidine kinase [bacterium]|nr:MAG: signal transduction histidine kinase [bacterium]
MGIYKPNGALSWISINTQPLINPGQTKPYGVVSSFHDITKRRQAEEDLRESEAQLREAQQIARIGSWSIELSTNTLRWSDETYKIFEADPKQFDRSKTAFMAMIHPEDRDMVDKTFSDSLVNKFPFQVIHRILLPNQRVKFLQTQGIHYHDNNDQPLRSVGTVQDITERVIANQKIIASLREKEAMLKEIHHRVKNNLQIINSLLNLQSAHIKDPIVTAAFTETKNRVRSMSLLHETLYKSENFARIDLFSYVNSLCAHLCRSYGTNNKTKVLIDIAEIELDLEHTIPIGLIINELVSNALKYAFVDKDYGIINVKLMKSDDKLILIVSDNGKGLSKEVDFQHTLGLSLVSDLTSQLRGTIKLDNNNGTVFNISFPH